MRYKDWEKKLIHFIVKRGSTPMKWGENDCVLFCCDAIKSMSGIDPAFWIRGKYNSKIEAMRIVANTPFETTQEITKHCFDDVMQRQILARKLQFGDIVLAEIKNIDPEATGPTTGIIDRYGDMLVPGLTGLSYISNPQPEVVWSL